MLEGLATMLMVGASVAVIGRLVVVALRDFIAWDNARALDAQDGFTPSMRRWGYVGEKRGGK